MRLKVRECARVTYVPTAHFRLSEELLDQAQRAADADRRSLSNWLALTVERALSKSDPKAGHQEPAETEIPT